jgi:hypothetical protein
MNTQIQTRGVKEQKFVWGLFDVGARCACRNRRLKTKQIAEITDEQRQIQDDASSALASTGIVQRPGPSPLKRETQVRFLLPVLSVLGCRTSLALLGSQPQS